MNMLPLCLSRNWEQTGVHFSSLQLSSVGEPVPDTASHFCSWLKEAEHDVVLWYCSQSASRLDVIWILRYFSVRRRTAWWSELLPVFPFSHVSSHIPRVCISSRFLCLPAFHCCHMSGWLNKSKKKEVCSCSALGEFICTFDLTQCRSQRLWSIGE